ncbi:biotin--[acetyl-CoA-carboxylase] ligase [Phocea massiliensis]|uniref:Bifunctional ligase/repressor BirA n=1 Tax=Merdimmobilis hominis TaxID=2897707 RepID=A0A939BEH4_9FIRM|nr:biotin--[acetyl-CoA-carboxylase] ligase [Merdimmobilis hominis]MBM6920608.1 biotin--[acetyl-CoA-carboxylase] ligase [Merdimmobilis hominis]
MATKERVLSFLEAHKGNDISGAMIAESLGVSRASVWKAVETLRSEGYPIDAASKKGYRLANRSDILSKESIVPFLKPNSRIKEIHVYKEVDSTNTVAKQLANAGAPDGVLVAAEHQTAGRGRMGRQFYSPKENGVYFSVMRRLPFPAEVTTLVTSAAAVAVCRAIQSLYGIEAQIKWVNDVYIAGKKVCGILTEASMNFEHQTLDYVVVGIGVNVTAQEYPPELASIITSLDQHTSEPIDRSQLIAAIVNELEDFCENLSARTFLPEYRARSFLIGQPIRVISPMQTYEAKAIEIDDDGHLVVQTADGTTKTVNSGEVSVRPVK